MLDEPRIARFVPVLGAPSVKAEVVAALDGVRSAYRDGELRGAEPAVAAALARLSDGAARALIPVLNGTGILLHTNLGRAPLAAEALAAVEAIASGYSNLEFDLPTGRRGSRYDRVGDLLRAATGAEAALVVNNGAAALLLIVDTFARGREAIVARNALIEIGGGLRLPDVLVRSGAQLVEVGATNKVYLDDFVRALGPRSGLILRAHPSNYRIDGFVADVAPADLAALGRRAAIPVVEDLGTGALIDLSVYGLPAERTVGAAVADGSTLVAFSGDKLLGGPQAGIIVGQRAAVARLRANPLLRALRVDKATLAALGATLRLHLDPAARERIPFYAMLARSPASLRERAAELACAIPGLAVLETTAFAGGGTLPLAAIPSVGVGLRPAAGAEAALACLRAGSPPLVARVEAGQLVVDLRTIDPVDDRRIGEALGALG